MEKETKKTEQKVPMTREQLEKKLHDLEIARKFVPLLLGVLALPVAIGILGGAMWGFFALFSLISPMWWLAHAMGIVGAIGGVALAVVIGQGSGKAIRKEIDETCEKIDALENEIKTTG